MVCPKTQPTSFCTHEAHPSYHPNLELESNFHPCTLFHPSRREAAHIQVLTNTKGYYCLFLLCTSRIGLFVVGIYIYAWQRHFYLIHSKDFTFTCKVESTLYFKETALNSLTSHFERGNHKDP